MEDLNLNSKYNFKFESEDVEVSISNIFDILSNRLKNTFNFLCELRTLADLTKGNPVQQKYIGFTLIDENGNKFTKNIYDILHILYGFAPKTSCRYFTIAEYFLEWRAGALSYTHKLFYSYSISKLQELTPLLVWQIDDLIEHKILTKNLTKKQIRFIVKRLSELGGANYNKYDPADFIMEEENKSKITSAEEENFDNLENSFDIRNEYTFEYFRERSKNQLIDIAFKCYQKYKELQKSGVVVKKTKKGGDK